MNVTHSILYGDPRYEHRNIGIICGDNEQNSRSNQFSYPQTSLSMFYNTQEYSQLYTKMYVKYRKQGFSKEIDNLKDFMHDTSFNSLVSCPMCQCGSNQNQSHTLYK